MKKRYYKIILFTLLFQKEFFSMLTYYACFHFSLNVAIASGSAAIDSLQTIDLNSEQNPNANETGHIRVISVLLLW